MSNKANYGIDAPTIVRNNAIVGAILWAASLAAYALLHRRAPALAAQILAQGGVAGTIFAAVAAYMLWSSKVGKFRIRNRLLNAIPWRGDEHILDIGCGRGLALIGAAHRLTTGHATGIDLWSAHDLSRNAPAATLANAEIENVASRVTIQTADARALPFETATFDAVISMTTIHNIPEIAGRRQAIAEAVRVLKPGGALAIFDIFQIRAYQTWLLECGMQNITASGIILLWLVPGRLITATKPHPAPAEPNA